MGGSIRRCTVLAVAWFCLNAVGCGGPGGDPAETTDASTEATSSTSGSSTSGADLPSSDCPVHDGAKVGFELPTLDLEAPVEIDEACVLASVAVEGGANSLRFECPSRGFDVRLAPEPALGLEWALPMDVEVRMDAFAPNGDFNHLRVGGPEGWLFTAVSSPQLSVPGFELFPVELRTEDLDCDPEESFTGVLSYRQGLVLGDEDAVSIVDGEHREGLSFGGDEAEVWVEQALRVDAEDCVDCQPAYVHMLAVRR